MSDEWRNVVYVWKSECWNCESPITKIKDRSETWTNGKFDGFSSNGSVEEAKMIELAGKYSVKFEERYSKHVDASYYTVVCPNCDIITGDFYLKGNLFELATVDSDFIEKHKVYDEPTDPIQQEPNFDQFK